MSNDKPPTPIVEAETKPRTPIDELTGLIIKAGAELRKELKWSDNSYHMIYGANSSDPKGYYLYGVLNEIEKACFSVMQADDWIKESEDSYDPSTYDDEDKQRINDNLLQSRIDELSVWERKMTELMVTLVGFREVNEEDYYRHFLAVHELQHLSHSQNDLKEYYGMKSENYAYQQQELHELIDNIAKQLDVSKTWYVKKKTNTLKRTLEVFSKRFEYSFELMEEPLRATLRTQYLSFGSQSRNIHVGTVSDAQNLELKDVSAHVGRVGMLAIHVVVLVKELIGADTAGGALETCSRIINENDYPVDLHRRRTNPDVIVGDFVVAGGDLAQVVKVNISQKYGFKSFRVRFLEREPLPGITEDEFVGEHIRRIYRGEDLIKQTIEMAKKINPDVTPSEEEINQSMREGIVLEWNNGLREFALNQPGGKEKLEAFRQEMNKQVAPIKKLLGESD